MIEVWPNHARSPLAETNGTLDVYLSSKKTKLGIAD